MTINSYWLADFQIKVLLLQRLKRLS